MGFKMTARTGEPGMSGSPEIGGISAVPQESENSGLFLTSLQTALDHFLPVPLLHAGKAI